jgi:hypothetical protein
VYNGDLDMDWAAILLSYQLERVAMRNAVQHQEVCLAHPPFSISTLEFQAKQTCTWLIEAVSSVAVF